MIVTGCAGKTTYYRSIWDVFFPSFLPFFLLFQCFIWDDSYPEITAKILYRSHWFIKKHKGRCFSCLSFFFLSPHFDVKRNCGTKVDELAQSKEQEQVQFFSFPSTLACYLLTCIHSHTIISIANDRFGSVHQDLSWTAALFIPASHFIRSFHPSIISWRSVLVFPCKGWCVPSALYFHSWIFQDFASYSSHFLDTSSGRVFFIVIAIIRTSIDTKQGLMRRYCGTVSFCLMVQKHLWYSLPHAGKFLSSNLWGVTQSSWSEGWFAGQCAWLKISSETCRRLYSIKCIQA